MPLSAIFDNPTKSPNLRGWRIPIATLLAAVVVGMTMIAVPTAQADPDDVTADDVREAYAKAEKASEKVNAVSEKIETAQADVKSIRKDNKAKRTAFNKKRQQLGSMIARQHMDWPMGRTMKLIGSGDPKKVNVDLGTIKAIKSNQANALKSYRADAKDLENREKQLEAREKDLQAHKDKAQKAQTKVRSEYEQAKSDYDELKASEQDEVDDDSGKSEKPDKPDVKASGKVKEAIDFATSQVGGTYSYGSAGPDSFDCSGLMQAAFSKIGVSIGRSTSNQIGAGKSVSISDVEPGDLVFYDSESHVGMYIGGNKVVNAANPSAGIVVSPLSQYSKARRVG